jgi:hypothetical protein
VPRFDNGAVSGLIRFRRRRRSQILGFGLFFNLRPSFALAPRDGLFVAFDRSSCRALATPAKLPQKAPYVSGVIGDPTLLFDQIRHPRRGPQSRVIAERFRSALQSPLDAFQIFGAQARLPSGSTRLLETGAAFFFQLLRPATERLAMHTDSPSDFRLTEALFE